MLIFCLSAYRSIQYGHILILLLTFGTLISFLQENKFFAYSIRAGHMSTSLNLQLSSSSVGYLNESANPIVEHVQISEKKYIEGVGGCSFPLRGKKNEAPFPFKEERGRF